ncbi:cytochrome b561 (plasmid) [Rahnella aquatilis]|uniref:Cytochrome b561 n=1 Tax=Rahnella perminowiae TaxID=2816244 RepID=A0ABS6L3U4_9GAMM|nr:cytochrome b561 [Rahnella perminowiae]MBU9836403.1 cytochrome b561 [Rahnella perminowiae]UJD92134.1 cytochrome b561 [Rahnella aquatilis]
MRSRYSSVQIVIHWLVLVLVVFTYTTMDIKGAFARGSQVRELLTLTHYSLGFCVLFLMCVRVFVRAMYSTPPVKPAPPRWQHNLAVLTHMVIYLMFIGLPVLGILSKYYAGHDWTMFNIMMPKSVFPDMELQRQLKTVHMWLANTGYYLIGLHALAALWHHYRLRDNTLVRMLPGRK